MHLSRGLIAELARRTIPFITYNGLECRETADIKDLLCTAPVLARNPSDAIATSVGCLPASLLLVLVRVLILSERAQRLDAREPPVTQLLRATWMERMRCCVLVFFTGLEMAERDTGLPLLAHARFEGDALILEFSGRAPVECTVKPGVMRALALAVLNRQLGTVQDHVIETRKSGDLPVLAYSVHAYTGATDAFPNAVFEVFARSAEEAAWLVRREKTASTYQRLVCKKGHIGVIRFTPVKQPRALPGHDAG